MSEAKKDNRTKAELLEEIAELHARLDEAEQTLDAIRSGNVDALVVTGPQGEQIYSLTGAEQVYRVIIEAMNEGALTMDLGGYILFCNRRFCEMVKTPMEAIVGKRFTNFAAPAQQPAIRALVADAKAGRSVGAWCSRPAAAHPCPSSSRPISSSPPIPPASAWWSPT